MNNTIKTVIKSVGTLAVMTVFVLNLQTSAKGAAEALQLCTKTVVPSLFPFMAVSSYVMKSGILSNESRLLDKVCKILFRLPGRAAAVFVMSMLGGFPVGARLVDEGLKNGSLTQNQCKRMLLFCVSPGPAFTINAVGEFMLSDKKAGLLLFISILVSSLVTALISRFFSDNSATDEINTVYDISSPFVDSVKDSANAVIGVCAWIVVFSSVLGILNSLPVDENLKQWLNMFAEITRGCQIAAGNFPLPVIALLLGWSGLSVHAQVSPYIRSVGLKYKYFAVSRLFNGTLSMGIAWALFKAFPCEIDVFSNMGEITPQAVSVSLPATVGLLFLSALVILDLAPKRKV